MEAKDLKKQMGDLLLGRSIKTVPFGDYPGGIAIIYDLGHDPAAPEIVMNVVLPGWGRIGVFEYEEVELQPEACSVPKTSTDEIHQVEDATVVLECELAVERLTTTK